MKHDDDEPHDGETTSMNDEPLPGDASVNENEPPAPVVVEEPVVSCTETDFNAMLGSFNDLVLHVVVDHVADDDDGGDGDPHARVGRYEVPAP